MKIIMMSMDVKKFILVSLLGLLSLVGFSQTAKEGTFTIEGGVGLNAYRLQSNQEFGKTTGASWNGNGMVGYYFSDRVNLNLEYQFHSYLLGEDSTDVNNTQYISSNRLGIGLRYAVIDKPAYQLSIGGTVGIFDFVSGFEDSTSVVTIYADGIYQNYGITNNFYFGESRSVGMFIKLGIVNNPMTLRDIIVNDEHKEVFQGKEVNEFKFNSIGYYFNLGLAINLGRK